MRVVALHCCCVTVVSIRRLAARHAPEGEDADPFVRRLRRRAIAWAFLFMVLVLRKGAAVLHLDFDHVLGVAGALIVAALVVYFVRRERRVAPPEPKDEDTELAGSAIEAELRAGTLSPHDLVRQNGVWTTLLESVEFGDAAADRHAVLERRALALKSIAIAVGVATAVGLCAALFNAGNVLTWLAAP